MLKSFCEDVRKNFSSTEKFFSIKMIMTEILEWKKYSYALESLESGKRPPFLRAKFISCRSCSDVLASRLAESMLRVVVASRSNDLWQMVVSEKATWKTVMEEYATAMSLSGQGLHFWVGDQKVSRLWFQIFLCSPLIGEDSHFD